MRQQQEFETDALVGIIHTIQLERGTGQLTVRRGIGMAQEAGTILFTNGQVTEAKVGRRAGAAALNWMSSWETCFYSFISSHPTGQILPHPFLSQKPVELSTARKTEPFEPVSPLRQTTGSYEAITLKNFREKALIPAKAIPFPTTNYNFAMKVLEHSTLSRTHRQLLLLIDGQRSVTELARIMARTHEEIYGLLEDLGRTALIQIKNE